MVVFADRRDAGRRLAAALMHFKRIEPIVLALPRGGVPVGYEVARALDAPLDVVLVRKIGAPHQPELGIGAVVDGPEPQVVLDDELVAVFTGIYNEPDRQWDVYEACEELVDVEDTFQTWRFRHLKTVERVIGFKKGTGGSSGVSFLRRALDLTFFPELYAVRTEIGH